MNNGYEHASQYQLFLCAYLHGKRVMSSACERVITCRVRAFTLFPEIPWRVTYDLLVLKRTVCLKAWLSSTTRRPRLRCLSRTRCRSALLRLLLLLPRRPKPHHLQFHREHCWCHRTWTISLSINWDLSPCSVDLPQHYLFTGRSLLSGGRVGKRAVNHPGFVLRTDLCFEWLIDALIKGLENWSEAIGNYGNIDVLSVK